MVIYQTDPLYYPKTNTHHKPRGWTECVVGYLNEARKEAYRLNTNRKLANANYQWLITINVEVEQSPSEIKASWSGATRRLRKSGLVAHWTVEPTTSSKVHYHLLVLGEHTEKELRETVKKAMSGVKHHCNVRTIPQDDASQYEFCCYVVKAKLPRGKCKDINAKKRLLFVKGLGITKIGKIGDFWAKPKGGIWQDLVAEQKQIAKNLEDNHLWFLVDHIYELIGNTPSPWSKVGKAITEYDIKKAISKHSNNPAIKHWAAKLGIENDDEIEDKPWQKQKKRVPRKYWRRKALRFGVGSDDSGGRNADLTRLHSDLHYKNCNSSSEAKKLLMGLLPIGCIVASSGACFLCWAA
ncbi:MAG: hypothetical protein LLF97_06815 [Planctomycetaceae bacterium]|nr:hypothetical protein [Planctomycetaceae bacterium]